MTDSPVTSASSLEAHLAVAEGHRLEGRVAEAERLYRDLARQAPGDMRATVGLGTSLRQLGRLAEAHQLFLGAAGSAPGNIAVQLGLGDTLRAMSWNHDALAAYGRAADLADTDTSAANLGRQAKVKALAALAELYANLNRVEEAEARLRQALDIEPENDGLRLALAMMLGPIPMSTAAIDATRSRMLRELDELQRRDISLADPFADTFLGLFYLAYHGRDDRPILEKLSALLLAATPSLGEPAKAPRSAPVEGRKIKLGVVSPTVRQDHSIAYLFAELIRRLDRSRFDVVVFDATGMPLRSDEVARIVQLPKALEPAKQTILAEMPDVLLYPDSSTDAFTRLLPYARLAPVQATIWGHPATSGAAHMDYFLSSEDLDPPGAEKYYTESLIRMRHLQTWYRRPTRPVVAKTRADFGLPEDAHLYLCPQSLFKLHPDFDVTVADILRGDPDGYVVFVSGVYGPWDDILRSRIAARFPDIVHRLKFVARSPRAGFLALLAVVDVVLDPPCVGSGNAAIEAFAMGTPVVTLPDQLLRSRITYACYQAMGFADLVADSPAAYVSLAHKLARDSAFRDEMRSKIRQSAGALFENDAAVREMEGFLAAAVAAAAIGKRIDSWQAA